MRAPTGFPALVLGLSVGLFVAGGALLAERKGLLDGRAGLMAQIPGFGPPDLENRLAGARSPYLRSAAEQPVAWQEWGPEAFELAAELDRPIWLDIGAIWCHWCHVMDRESYEHPDVAALINASFVPIKVDRDERADIDDRYQTAHQALTGRAGGWPLTMFLTPDGHPFAAATYLPPDSRGGRPGIRQIAPAVAKAYVEQRGELEGIASQVRQLLAEAGSQAGAAGDLSPAVVEAIARDVQGQLDPDHGGFGRTAGPKFPHAEALRLALAEGFLRGDQALVDAVLRTLDAYASSGMYDHLHGGFFRYSTNRELTVPHFEKMDYVQSQLLRAYLAAYRLTGERRHADVARDIMRYVDRTLSDRQRGGFYPHQDADVSLDDDGSYYTWSRAQLAAALHEEETLAAALYYDIGELGEMREHRDQNVLRIARSPAEAARELGITETEAMRRIESATERMAATRRKEKAPLVEETLFTDRNALMISAYLDAAVTLEDEDARTFALRSLDRILESAVRPDGAVLHATAGSESYVEGLLTDHVGLVQALLDAYQVTGRKPYLDTAVRVMERALDVFLDSERGGFFDRRADPTDLALLASRNRDFHDAPQPGANAVAARALETLYLLTSEERWRERAEATLAAFAGAAKGSGLFGSSYAMALRMHLDKPPQTVVIGPAGEQLTQELERAAWHTYRPGRVVASYDPEVVDLENLPPPVAAAARVFADDPEPRAYVCVGTTCAPPTSDPAQVATLVRDYGRVGPR